MIKPKVVLQDLALGSYTEGGGEGASLQVCGRWSL